MSTVPISAYEKAFEAARLIIEACGRSLEEASLSRTPERFAEFLTEEMPVILSEEDFENGISMEKYDELILEQDIPFLSLCEHHLLPFFGKAHIGYIPHAKRLSGLSKLARVVYMFAGALSIQERLTTQIAEFLNERLDPKGVMVIMEATHLCMVGRGARAVGSKTTTSAVRGVFLTNPAARSEMQMLLLRGG